MLLLLLGACTSGPYETPTCRDVLVPAAVSGCFSRPSGDTGADTGASPGDWEGEVVESVTGAFPAACDQVVADPASGSGWAVRVATEVGDVWAGVETPGSNPPDVGGTVRVRTFRSTAEFGPILASVEVSAGGVIVGYVGEAGSPVDLTPLGIALEVGEPACLEQDSCGDWRGYGLEVSVGTAQGLGVPYGTTTTIGTFQVTNADLRLQVGDGASCPDWFVASTRVGIGR